jgi:hypothetical protein
VDKVQSRVCWDGTGVDLYKTKCENCEVHGAGTRNWSW